MTNSWKIGGVTLELREDGNFSIYQPDSNRVMTQEMALEVAQTINTAFFDADYPDVSGGGVPYSLQPTGPELDRVANILDQADAELAAHPPRQVTVPDGVISTTEGPQYTASEYREEGPVLPKLTDTEIEADANAELGRKQAAPKPPVKRRPGRPRKTT